MAPAREPSPTPNQDDPPPAYTEDPNDGPVLDAGPRYPFGFTDQEPIPQHQQPFPHQQPYPNQQFHAPPPLPHRPYHTGPAGGGYSPTAGPSTPPALPHRPVSSDGALRGDDDWEPTAQPRPGRVLMHNGKVLAYPAGYDCPKCHNVGYKFGDPVHPCRKCWDKYGKSWNLIKHAPDARNLSQRPLPSTLPNNTFRTSSPYDDLAYSQTSTTSYVPYAAPSAPFEPYTPYGPRPSPGGPNPAFQYVPSDRQRAGGYTPDGRQRPLVVQPGDPRIGGRLCHVCDGAGRVAKRGLGNFVGYMLGEPDDEVCAACRGTGRLF